MGCVNIPLASSPYFLSYCISIPEQGTKEEASRKKTKEALAVLDFIATSLGFPFSAA